MKEVAKILIFDSLGNILVLRRSSTHPHYPLHLDFPGGVVDPPESPIEGALREITEETGIVLKKPDLTQLLVKENIKNERHYLFKAVLIEKPEINISWEHDQHEWMSPQMILNSQVPANVDIIYALMTDYIKENYS